MTDIPLIDKQDNFEIVLAQIGAILATETTSQQALATAAAKDPTLWEFDVYLDRYNPLEQFQDDADAIPLVNIWYENSNFPDSATHSVGTQVSESTYNLDIYASAASADNPAGGYDRSDETSTANLHRIVRLVRNIIMHPKYQYLELSIDRSSKKQNLVWRRWTESITVFQPQINDRPVQGVIAARLTLRVKFNETLVAREWEPLEAIYTTAKRAEDGKVIFEAQFDTT